jgi:solute carrier family 25 (mitochondrial phosphate transporter), member 3
MPLLFPSQDTLHDVFHPAVPFGRLRATSQPQLSPVASKPTPLQARSELYPAWSVVDAAKDKANKLSAEATKEFEKASAKAQAKAGHIELYTAKYYAACTFGGLLACVSAFLQTIITIREV